MSAGTISTVISSGVGVLFLVLGVLGFLQRRANQKVSNLAAVRETNVAALQWSYQVRTLAAMHGATWLPVLPREMTPEYLAGKATNEDNPELAQLADYASKMLPTGDQT